VKKPVTVKVPVVDNKLDEIYQERNKAFAEADEFQLEEVREEISLYLSNFINSFSNSI
jgi:hypothetical protein